MKIGICGIGFVGNAMMLSYLEKGYKLDKSLFIYDKFKDGGMGTFESLMATDLLFLTLPTIYQYDTLSYDKTAIVDSLTNLKAKGYKGCIVLKSTVEPTVTEKLAAEFGLNLVHNPEFLTARTAKEDFHNQKHIVLGRSSVCSDECFNNLVTFYAKNYPDAVISKCTSNESESMKLFSNTFYAVKVQMFTEFYLLCKKTNVDYNTVKDLMLKNGWINPMHTTVPGPDGNISYGGLCFPKDTNALLQYMKSNDVPHEVLEAVIREREDMRDDHHNTSRQ